MNENKPSIKNWILFIIIVILVVGFLLLDMFGIELVARVI